MSCKKTLTMVAVVAATVMALSACTDSTDPGADATGISDERLAAPDDIDPDQIGDTAGNADEDDIPMHMVHLLGQVEPEHVSIMCVGDYAFLHTWTSGLARRIGVDNAANATTVRFAEHDELCVQAQS